MTHCNWLKILYPINPETGRSGNLWFFDPKVDRFLDHVEINHETGFLIQSRETGLYMLIRTNGVRVSLPQSVCEQYAQVRN